MNSVLGAIHPLYSLAGVLVGLLVLLALIVTLSARPSEKRGTTTAARTPSWVVDTGQKHPDAWAPLSNTSTHARALR